MQHIAFYVNLLSLAEVRHRIASGPMSDVQELIDQMEDGIPHDHLPPCYDWLVSLRNRRRTAA
jgi:hypothetical protein